MRGSRVEEIMRALVLLVAVGSIGCGIPDRGAVVARCDVPGWGAFAFEFDASCDLVLSNVETARRVLDRAGFVPANSFFAEFQGTAVHVRAVDWLTWDPVQQKGVDGVYDVLAGVDLTQGMHSLTHELLHVWDAKHGRITSFSHPSWSSNGYNAASNRYLDERVDVTRP